MELFYLQATVHHKKEDNCSGNVNWIDVHEKVNLSHIFIWEGEKKSLFPPQLKDFS